MTFYELLVYLAENEHLPVVMKDLGIALITIFIGVLIFIIPPSEKNIQDNVDAALKKYLISKEVINAKLLLSGVLLIYLPFLLTDLWNNKHSWAKLLDANPSRKIEVEIFALFLSILGICIILYILYNCYKWIISDIEELAGNNNNYYNKLEKKYLTIDSEPSATLKLFYLIWKRKYEDEDARKEKEYFDYFITWLNKLCENKEYQYSQNGLAVFSYQIQNRNLNNSYLFSESFSAWLKLFFKTLDKNNNTKNLSSVDEGLAMLSLGNILSHYIKFSLQDNSFILTTVSLFSTIEKQATDKPEWAVKEFFNLSAFTDILFENKSIWKGNQFPQKWKFHLDNNKDNIFGTIFLDKFLDNHINIPFYPLDDNTKKEIAARANHNGYILENLFFDKIDPEVFSYFFKMIYMPIELLPNPMQWLAEEYVHNFYGGGKTYPIRGWSGATVPSQEERERQRREDAKKMEKNTFKFFWLDYRDYKVLQPESIKKNIGELRQIIYSKETQAREFYRREYLIRIFKKWLLYYKKQSDNQPTTTPTTSIPEA